MRTRTTVTDDLYRYLLEHSMPADAIVTDLIEETLDVLPDRAGMQIGGEQGRLLHLLVKLTGATRLLEIGTFTGMSALWMARALPPDGSLLCLDVNEEWTEIARRYWQRAGVDHLIDLEIGPALDTLRAMAPEPTSPTTRRTSTRSSPGCIRAGCWSPTTSSGTGGSSTAGTRPTTPRRSADSTG
jgi:caffeoyl-CoA O-methyltransferase